MAMAPAPVGSAVLDKASELADEFQKSPWETSSRWMMESGIVMMVAGGLGWLTGSYLTQAAAQADADAGRRLAFVGATFQNAAQVGGAVGGAIANLFTGVVTQKVSITYPDSIEILTATPGKTLTSALTADLTILDSTGKAVFQQTGIAFTENNNLWSGPATLYSLADGPSYVIQLTIHQDGAALLAEWQTAFLGSNGIYAVANFSGTPAAGIPAGAVFVGGQDATVTAFPGAATGTPTQGAPSSSGPQYSTFGVLAGDLVGGIVGAAVGITEIPQAIWAFGQVFPYLLWDGLVTVLAGGLGWLGTNLGPYLFGAGAFLLAVGIVVRFGAERLFPRIELAAEAKLGGLTARLDTWLGTDKALPKVSASNEKQARIEEVASGGSQEGPVPPSGKSPQPSGPSGPDSLTGGPAPPDSDAPGDIAVGSATGEASQGPPVPPEGPGAVPTDLPPPEDRPSPGPTPTADIEAELGGHQAIEPSAEELREMERNRRASHPDPGVLEPESGTDGLTDEEYFALVDQMRTPIVEANTYAKASDASDLQTSIIKQAQSNRREAKVRMDVLGKKGFSKKQHRGALEGMNAGMNPDQYGD